jgi:hypothetical protein
MFFPDVLDVLQRGPLHDAIDHDQAAARIAAVFGADAGILARAVEAANVLEHELRVVWPARAGLDEGHDLRQLHRGVAHHVHASDHFAATGLLTCQPSAGASRRRQGQGHDGAHSPWDTSPGRPGDGSRACLHGEPREELLSSV